ncbi:MAG: hypothetical protein EZS28_004759 [Streblomastix strix]|uniref:Uncharacterized protein n=1 Tax=Streblomastix strix TaxID=222440 RepID=A0A5J4WZE5_9EUKA|nr:MAG: hypothetical protein EZS28_004759 [Streblomastix strix]
MKQLKRTSEDNFRWNKIRKLDVNDITESEIDPEDRSQLELGAGDILLIRSELYELMNDIISGAICWNAECLSKINLENQSSIRANCEITVNMAN